MQNTAIIEDNLGLVKKIAYEYSRKSNIDYDDLFQEGVIGLIKAAEKFDPKLGNAFSTYAVYWIKQKMQRYIESNLHASAAGRKSRGKIYAVRHRLEEEGKNPTPEMIATELGLTVSDVIGVLSPDVLSLDSPMNCDEDGCLLDTLSVDDEIDFGIENEYKTQMIRDAISKLPDRERTVIMERYFSKNGKLATYDEVSEKIGVSKQRIQQIEKRALDKLKRTKELLEYHRSL